MRLTGKVALVTGCAQGMGAAICRRFVQEGAAVIAADSNELGGALADELVSTGAVCSFHRLNVRSERDWTTAMSLTMQRHGRLDVLVNNAGIDIPGDIEQTTLDDWRTTFGVNVESLLLGTRLAVSQR
jgi:NAD(P)-dependent dehydrogenase (short-subunit alcohol dehydrogenase family)